MGWDRVSWGGRGGRGGGARARVKKERERAGAGADALGSERERERAREEDKAPHQRQHTTCNYTCSLDRNYTCSLDRYFPSPSRSKLINRVQKGGGERRDYESDKDLVSRFFF